MPVSLFCGVLFSEAPFQRVWASASPRVVWTAAAMSAVAVTTTTTFAGLCGLLAAWAGLIPAWVSPNLYFFYALKGSINAQGQIANWVGVVSAPAGRAFVAPWAPSPAPASNAPTGPIPCPVPAGLHCVDGHDERVNPRQHTGQPAQRCLLVAASRRMPWRMHVALMRLPRPPLLQNGIGAALSSHLLKGRCARAGGCLQTAAVLPAGMWPPQRPPRRPAGRHARPVAGRSSGPRCWWWWPMCRSLRWARRGFRSSR